ncbi:MAG: arginyltransferase [Deltaproteobacteria bacterium]|nr:arginyltransferase [Deltaproteobacteria bacterium]
MARVLEHFTSEPRACAYLAREEASLEYKIMLGIGAAELERLLERGWRRFGPAYFRPACAACSACVPLRIPVDRFEPSRSQRRVLRGGVDFELEIGVPLVDALRLELYELWHQDRSERRGWADNEMDPQRYFHEFAFPHPAVREVTLWDPNGPSGRRLIAVGIMDETPEAFSAVYTYHHPAYQRRSLGTLSVLRQIELARRAQKRWLYLGYRVLGCVSSEYKAQFQPHELLHGWPGPEDAPDWRPAG